MSRLAERRAFNRQVAEGLAREPVGPERLPADTSARRFHAVRVNGAFDYDREIVLTSRIRRGAPGVHVFTPLRRAGNDTAVLVNRGWIYSPDGAEADLSGWRDADTVAVSGWVDRFAEPSSRPITASANPRGVHRLDFVQIRKRFPYPVAPYVIVWTDSVAAPRASTLPARLGTPDLTEGSHLSYAIQWFSFAAIGLVGIVVFIRKTRRSSMIRPEINGRPRI